MVGLGTLATQVSNRPIVEVSSSVSCSVLWITRQYLILEGERGFSIPVGPNSRSLGTKLHLLISPVEGEIRVCTRENGKIS